MIYSHQPFWDFCNFAVEFPCFPVNYSHATGHSIYERFCISSGKIGDGYIDCMGRIDERNTLKYCNATYMLG